MYCVASLVSLCSIYPTATSRTNCQYWVISGCHSILFTSLLFYSILPVTCQLYLSENLWMKEKTVKHQKGRRYSRGDTRVKVFPFRSHKHTEGDTQLHTHAHTHTQPFIHACWSNHRAWQRMTIWGLHHHQNKSNPKDPSSHLNRGPSQPIRSGAADCWAEYWYTEFRLPGWIPI